MGPAAQRREHTETDRISRPVFATQWSPPLNGGSTLAIPALILDITQPQWSPPSDGGSTCQAGRRGRSASRPALCCAGSTQSRVPGDSGLTDTPT